MGQETRSWWGKIWNTGLTEARNIRGINKERDQVFRWERGQLLEILCRMRERVSQLRQLGEDTTTEEEILRKFRIKAGQAKWDLEEINSQFHQQRIWVEVDRPEIGRHKLPMAEVGLSRYRGRGDKRVPHFLVGGVSSSLAKNVSLATALAMTGKRVIVMPYPELEEAESPRNWEWRLKNVGGFELHAILAKEVIKKMGLTKVNLVGLSTGGGIILEMARDPKFNHRIQDLVSVDPMGFEERSLLEMGFGLYLRAGLSCMFDAESRTKLVASQLRRSENGDYGLFLTLADILRRQQFDERNLAEVNVRGKYQVWLGTESELLSADHAEGLLLRAEMTRQKEGQKPVEIHRVEGGTHSLGAVYALGVIVHSDEADGRDLVREWQIDELESSVAQWLYTMVVAE